jgi:DNA-directed RNA polymerase specialized sigma24 family protein
MDEIDPHLANDAQLLALMAGHHSAPHLAQAAWGELYSRHAHITYGALTGIYGKTLQQADREGIVSDTYRRAYLWAVRKADPAAVEANFTSTDREGTRQTVLGWLGMIAQNLVMDCFAQRKSDDESLAAFLADHRYSLLPDVPGRRSELTEIVRRAMETLSPEEADALRLTLPWYSIEKSAIVMPPWEAFKIAERLGISVDALRKRRSRALARIRKYIKDAGQSPDQPGEKS